MRRKHLHDAPYNGADSPRKAAGEGVHSYEPPRGGRDSYGELFCKVASTGSYSLATRTHGRPCFGLCGFIALEVHRNLLRNVDGRVDRKSHCVVLNGKKN